jgi:hypothetical protein
VTWPNIKGIFGDFLCQQKVTGAQTMMFLKLKHSIAHQTIPQKLKSLPPDQIKSNWCACRKAKEWQTAVRTKLHHILSQLRFTDWLFLY